ncbi:MAG: hypothetical protein WC680_09475 [Sulfuricurvum sp.]
MNKLINFGLWNINYLFLLMLILVPLANCEAIYHYYFMSPDYGFLPSNIWIKIFSKYGPELLLAILLLRYQKFTLFKIYPVIIPFLVILISLSILNTLLTNEYPLLVFSGFVFIYPIVLIFLFYDYLQLSQLVNKTASILLTLFKIHFLIQLVEISYSLYLKYILEITPDSPLYLLTAVTYMRPAGLFLMPYSSALFSILVLWYLYHVKRLSIPWLLMILASIALTKSGTGLAIFILLFIFIYLFKSNIKKIIIFIPFIFLTIIISLPFLVDRADLFNSSFMPRITMFLDSYALTSWISNNFGFATTFATIASNYLHIQTGYEYGDSTYNQLLVNFGNLGLLGFIGLVGYVIYLQIKIKNSSGFVLCLIIILFSFTGSIFESYPNNILLSLYIAYLLHEGRKQVYVKK